ncbi:MAG: hypothetical protein AAB461_01980 [Patescibacteria group bacterium]
MLDKVKYITLGIRFNRSFGLADSQGQIVDEVLMNSPFTAEKLPLVNERIGSKTVYNPDTKEFFSITRDDLIFNMQVDKFDIDFYKITSQFVPFITDTLMKKYKIGKVHRIGVIFRHELKQNSNLYKTVERLTENKIQEPTSLIFRFTEKMAAPNWVSRGKDDYINTIYTFEQDNEKLFADLDYQIYLTPPVEDIRQAKPDKFLEDAKKFLVEKFHSWLKNYNQG